MKKLLILLSLLCVLGCSTQHQGGKDSYNVNIYDTRGEWYETGLLIESFDNRVFVKMDGGRYELLPSDKEEYRYMIVTDDEVLYVK